MAKLLSWLGTAKKKIQGGIETVNRDIVNPAERVGRSFVEGATEGPTQLGRSLAYGFSPDVRAAQHSAQGAQDASMNSILVARRGMARPGVTPEQRARYQHLLTTTEAQLPETNNMAENLSHEIVKNTNPVRAGAAFADTAFTGATAGFGAAGGQAARMAGRQALKQGGKWAATKAVTRELVQQGTKTAALSAPSGFAGTYVHDPNATARQALGNAGTTAVVGFVLPAAGAAAGEGARLATKAVRGLPRAQRTMLAETASKSKPLGRLHIDRLTPTDASGYGDLDPTQVAKYRDQIAKTGRIKPILVMRDPKGKLFVEDGKHRLAAAKSLGLQTIPGKIVNQEEVHRLAQGGYVSLPGRRGADEGSVPIGKTTRGRAPASESKPGSTSSRQASLPNSVPPAGQVEKIAEALPVVRTVADRPGATGADMEIAAREAAATNHQTLVPEADIIGGSIKSGDNVKVTTYPSNPNIASDVVEGKVLNTSEYRSLEGEYQGQKADIQLSDGSVVKDLPLNSDKKVKGERVGNTRVVYKTTRENDVATEPPAQPERLTRSLDIAPEHVSELQQAANEVRGYANPKPLSDVLKERTGGTRGMSDVERALYRAAKAQEAEMSGKVKAAAYNPIGAVVPDAVDEAVIHGSYPLNRKVGILDYLRTPERVLQKIGLGNEAKALREADHAYKQQLPKEIDRITKWFDEVGRSKDASERIFRYLDGQPGAKRLLQGNELRVAGEIKEYLSSWADRLKLPPEQRISNYITHIFDDAFISKEFDPDLEKLIADKVPGSVYDPFTQKRLGKRGYKQDAFVALDAYVKRATRKANFDPALEKLSYASQGLDKSGYDFVKHYGDRINMRPTMIDNLLDNMIKQSPVGYKLGNRPTARLSRGIRQATYRASLGLNIGSAVRNLTQGINTFAELGTRGTIDGYGRALHAIATRSTELQDVGVLDNSFVEDRTISAAKKLLQKADKGLFAFFEAAEKINRGAAYFGAKDAALRAGKSEAEAIQAGIDTARKTQFTFGRVDTPVALQDDLTKLVTQFQSYNVKQAEYLGEMVKNKEFAKLLRFTMASAAVFLTVGRALGYKPQDMLPSAQVGGTAPFQVPGTVGKAIATTATAKDTNQSTRGQKIVRAWMNVGNKVGSSVVPGFVQGKKTVTGVNAVNRGEVKQYGKPTMTIPKTPQNYATGALLGPYALHGAPKNQSNGGTTNSSMTGPDLLKDKAALTEAFGKDFAGLKNDAERKDWAKQSPDNQAIYDQFMAAKRALNPDINLPNGISQESAHILTQYAKMTDDGRQRLLDNQPDAEFKLHAAQFEQLLREGKLTTAQQINKEAALRKDRAGSAFPKQIRDMYGVGKANLYDYLTTPEDGVDKQKMADQLIAYDKALYEADIISNPKYKNGIAPAGSGSSKGTASVAAGPRTPKTGQITRSGMPTGSKYNRVALQGHSGGRQAAPQISVRRGIVYS